MRYTPQWGRNLYSGGEHNTEDVVCFVAPSDQWAVVWDLELLKAGWLSHRIGNPRRVFRKPL